MSPMAECVRRVGMLSKSELRSEARRLSGLVQENVARLVAHLAEIGRRGLPLEWGYAGLFEYCQKSLGMSEAEAGLRMQVAKVVRWCPALLDALAEGRMTLTVAGRIAPHLTEENAGTVIADCCGMTRNQVVEYVVKFRPKPVVSSGISKAPGSDGSSLWGDTGGGAADRSGEGRPDTAGGAPRGSASASAPTLAEAGPSTSELGAFAQGREAGSNFSGSMSGSGSNTASGSGAGGRSNSGASAGGASSRGGAGTRGGRGSIEAAEPGKFNVRFPVKRELKEKIDRLAAVLGFDHAGRNLEAIFEQAVEIALEKKDPRRKAERRAARLERAAREEARRVREDEAKSGAQGGARPAETPACEAPSWLDETSSEVRKPGEKPRPATTRNPRSGDSVDSTSQAETTGNPTARTSWPAETNGVSSKSASCLDETNGVSGKGASRLDETNGVSAKPASWPTKTNGVSGKSASWLDEMTDVTCEPASWPAKTEAGSDPTSRYVPAALRALVLQRANYQCEFVSREGRRCERVTKLEVDHVVPYAKGGPTEAGNLRCLCRSHNAWAAEQEFGEEFMRRRIAGAGGGEGFIAEGPAVAYGAFARLNGAGFIAELPAVAYDALARPTRSDHTSARPRLASCRRIFLNGEERAFERRA